jgi:hypothetical protein
MILYLVLLQESCYQIKNAIRGVQMNSAVNIKESGT